MSTPVKLGILISGGGRTMVNLAERIESGELDATIAVVISSRAGAAGVERARQRGLDVRIAEPAAFADPDARHDAIDRWLEEAGVELICLCGYLVWFRVGRRWKGRAINIHPALLPDFGGPGMYGNRVHRAVLASGRDESGCTVHYVDEIYDHGPVILQRRCPVLPGDDVGSLAARVFEQECIAYPEAIARIRHEGTEARRHEGTEGR